MSSSAGRIPLVLAAAALLLAFAQWFDFQCDDAFIALRYAENWVASGEIVYNVGERVEGYTSFSWVALLAGLYRLGIPLPMAAKLLGAMSGGLLLVFTAQYAQLLMPRRPIGHALLLAFVAGNACIAAWTLGGLETPLYAALVVANVVSVWKWLDQPTTRRAAIAAAILVAAMLTRPEAALLFVCCLLAFTATRASRSGPRGAPSESRGAPSESRRLPRGTGLLTGCSVVAGAGYLLWRHSYYGDWLPNTFYVKTSGNATELLKQGLAYLGFCAEEQGIGFALLVITLAFLPQRAIHEVNSSATDGPRMASDSMSTAVTSAPRMALPAESRAAFGYCWARFAVRSYLLLTLLYVASIGGDFLDLYRFLVPTFPLILGLATASGMALLDRWRSRGPASQNDAATSIIAARLRANGAGVLRAPWLQIIGIAVLLVWYAQHQVVLARRAMQLREPGRQAHLIEPLGWTATYARRWAATGRWIAGHSKPSDVLAVGAAGAMPFYAGLTNVDTFGLCDGYVARHGTLIGSRPGHQRFAPIDYLLRRDPTFLLINDYASDYPSRLRQDPIWDQRGYAWVEAQIVPEVHGAPTAFYHYLLVRKDRIPALVGTPFARVAQP